MRSRICRWSILCLANAVALAGCGGKVSSSNESCTNFLPCGGDPVGTWRLTDSCGELRSKVPFAGCSQPLTVQLTSYQATGDLTFGDDGAFSWVTQTTADLTWTIPPSCMTFQGYQLSCEAIAQVAPMVPQLQGLEGLVCRSANDVCECSAHLPAQPSDIDGAYSTAGGVLRLDSTECQYCVDGTRLTIARSMDETIGATIATGLLTLVAEKK